MSSPPEEVPDPPATTEMLHKTKLIQFLGRNTPIVLQNDNGPCPLLAIWLNWNWRLGIDSVGGYECSRFCICNGVGHFCEHFRSELEFKVETWELTLLAVMSAGNVLLLRNNLNLSADVAEVSQEKLLSLVAERLIDSNSNVNNKDAGYIENQQQNISDAIDLLPRLTTGIDVNLKFTRIDDFEFTRECAIFDLLDIPLYHGWIDSETAKAIGLKSYNTLMGELVSLETQNPQSEVKNSEEDFVDFVAATTASLGVPSPSLSTTKSFDEKKERKGDLEEEEELLRALKLSETETDVKVDDTSKINQSENPKDSSLNSQDPENVDMLTFQTDQMQYVSSPLQDKLHDQIEAASEKPNILVKSEMAMDGKDKSNPVPLLNTHVEDSPGEKIQDQGESDLAPPVHTHVDNSTMQYVSTPMQDKFHEQIEESAEKHDTLIKSEMGMDVQDESDLAPPVNTCVADSSVENVRDQEKSGIAPPVNTHVDNPPIEKIQDKSVEGNAVNLESSKDLTQSNDGSKSMCLTESGDGSEPIYEGEEHIHETSTANYENGEPMYEGEVVLAEQVDKVSSSAEETKGIVGITPKQGELIRNFLKNSANQLTIFGLFSLQDGLKERELCVFFRNNHFNTMFKFEGELYLLATDQGYINQPDLVWEKLNEVNGNTIYMTGSFKEFNAENPEPRSWDEQNALANTAVTQENTSFNSDLQLAIALQQQEFEQQQQQQQQQQTKQNMPQSSTIGQSGLVTGPQHVQPSKPRNSSSSSKQESKSSKEKCIVM
ncbi:hypothetical protein M8C21_005437 [Ambrosia artemisiifolia]|uniref:MINDY deubiquitinase domain-containing protein n=1 Tax=Ambrosia artemisiifolia TaxID=4212 RepID=A0AAD5D7Q7_AMBAR|nr:hypothetical protein M8C21_005437 [Ambrosia artemisiifolia]